MVHRRHALSICPGKPEKHLSDGQLLFGLLLVSIRYFPSMKQYPVCSLSTSTARCRSSIRGTGAFGSRRASAHRTHQSAIALIGPFQPAQFHILIHGMGQFLFQRPQSHGGDSRLPGVLAAIGTEAAPGTARGPWRPTGRLSPPVCINPFSTIWATYTAGAYVYGDYVQSILPLSPSRRFSGGPYWLIQRAALIAAILPHARSLSWLQYP